MNLFTKGVQNGNDSMIVSSQINSAAYYGRKNATVHLYHIFQLIITVFVVFHTEENFGNPTISVLIKGTYSEDCQVGI